MASDEQFIEQNPAALRHADDTLAFIDSMDPPTLPDNVVVKWINQPSEHSDEPGQFLVTTSREVIRLWAGDRRAKPALLKAADRSDPEQALRFQISERRESEYELISWDEWFGLMEGASLTFLFQERTPNGDPSDLFKLVPSASVSND